jgi:hypothetical protein
MNEGMIFFKLSLSVITHLAMNTYGGVEELTLTVDSRK